MYTKLTISPGDTFHRWKVIRRDTTRPSGNGKPVYWVVKCSCGNYGSVDTTSLKSGNSQSCGCYQKELISGERISKERKHLNKKFNQYRHGAIKRDYDFDLTIDDVEKLLNKKCHYCGNINSDGIDRVNNNIGYNIDNCVPCCKTCNRAKNNMTYEEFMQWIDNLITYRTGKI